MENKFQIDTLDKRILAILSRNARTPYLEVARKCKVSGAAVHQRMAQLTAHKVITGSQFMINPKALGYSTCAFIGLQINLTSTRTHDEVFQKIKQVSEIVECHHVTGKYSLFVKIHARDNEHLRKLITDKLQSIPEVTNTETFISLEKGFERQLPAE